MVLRVAQIRPFQESGPSACISSRITTVIHVANDHQTRQQYGGCVMGPGVSVCSQSVRKPCFVYLHPTLFLFIPSLYSLDVLVHFYL